MSDKITQFFGGNRWLSNFEMCSIVFDGVKYPSAEHAYQAAKTLDKGDRKAIAALNKPADAKRAGYKVKLRSDWEKIKFRVMLLVVRQKFTKHEYLRKLLLDTGDAELIEGNSWHDNYWGVCGCGSCSGGQNQLGRILMQVREELRNG